MNFVTDRSTSKDWYKRLGMIIIIEVSLQPSNPLLPLSFQSNSTHSSGKELMQYIFFYFIFLILMILDKVLKMTLNLRLSYNYKFTKDKSSKGYRKTCPKFQRSQGSPLSPSWNHNYSGIEWNSPNKFLIFKCLKINSSLIGENFKNMPSSSIDYERKQRFLLLGPKGRC